MSYFLQLTMSGLSIGIVYALIGLSLILMLRAADVMNFAQGSFLVLGAYTCYFLINKTPISSGFLRVLIAIVFFALVGCVFYLTCIRSFNKARAGVSGMVATIGANTIIVELCLMFGTRETKSVPPIIKGAVRVGSFMLQYQYIFVFVVCLVMLIGVMLIFDKLYSGRIMSAAAQNKYAADLLGIPTLLTTMLTFALCVVMSGVAGWLIAPVYLITTSIQNFQIKAFAGIIIGGFGSLEGAVLGGILVGLIEAYSTYITTSYKDVVIYAVLLLMLVIRPQGLLKSRVGLTNRA